MLGGVEVQGSAEVHISIERYDEKRLKLKQILCHIHNCSKYREYLQQTVGFVEIMWCEVFFFVLCLAPSGRLLQFHCDKRDISFCNSMKIEISATRR